MPENFIRCASVAIFDKSIEIYNDYPVFHGVRHPVIFAQIGAMGEYDIRKTYVQGFADKYWNFLTRSEAYKVAKEAGQLLKDTGSRGVLYSEDLY